MRPSTLTLSLRGQLLRIRPTDPTPRTVSELGYQGPTRFALPEGLLGVKRVEKLFYRILISVLRDDVKYDSFVIGSDEDLQVLHHCRRQFPEESSIRRTSSCSSSIPVRASSAVPVITPEAGLVASPSFAFNLNRGGDPGFGEIGLLGEEAFATLGPAATVPLVGVIGVPDGVEDALHDDDDDVESATIADDSDDDTPRPTSAVGGGASSSVGQQFQDKEEVVLSVKTYSIRRRVEYKVLESDNRKYYGKCKGFGSGCAWLIRVSLYHRRATSISSDHRKLDYHVISAFILPMIRADATISIKVPQNATEAHFGFRSTYMRVWMAKQKDVAQIYEDWKESYNDLPRWVLGVQITMPGSVVVLKTSPVRPLVCVDGTHLYEKYSGTLLVAIAKDGNSNIIPIAFALVELVISNRHNGIKAALEAADGGWLPPTAYRAFCIRHMLANFTLSFKGKDAWKWLVNAAYAKTEVEFHYWFDILHAEDPAMCNWTNRIDYAHWTQHRDDGRRFRHMTTNISECVNSILKGVRNFLVYALVKATYRRLAELFVRKGREAEAQLGTGQKFSQHLLKEIEANLKASRCFTVTI
ncbi:uncharacterized protein LOC107608035 [Arachis ipaensis]|uniref:uncharacterized protein LOC107608035 n=1 Tax=Arachis ipaensis TaxID=130454 RepID=UPI0007AF2C36|nr:uncharacterized protein LOC107608035 [Arachis ipaensis]